jgi:hypothetical protein
MKGKVDENRTFLVAAPTIIVGNVGKEMFINGR